MLIFKAERGEKRFLEGVCRWEIITLTTESFFFLSPFLCYLFEAAVEINKKKIKENY